MGMKRAITGTDAVYGFLRAYHSAPPGTDVEIGRAADQAATPVVTMSVGGQLFAVSPEEAVILAGVLEEAVRRFPSLPETHDLADVAMGLRESADRARRNIDAGAG